MFGGSMAHDQRRRQFTEVDTRLVGGIQETLVMAFLDMQTRL